MDKETEEKLLAGASRCPFCFGDDLVLIDIDPQVRGGIWSVGCMGCHACGPNHNFPGEAVKLWNSRDPWFQHQLDHMKEKK